MIRDCAVVSSGPFAQGIDISYSMTVGMSMVEGCDVSGGSEGIVTHDSMVMVGGNRVHGTSLRGITMSEMSMGEVAENTVLGARGVGVYCGDHSECEISRNVVTATRRGAPGDLSAGRRRHRAQLLRLRLPRPQRAARQPDARRRVLK